jgi:hypothetical protein
LAWPAVGSDVEKASPEFAKSHYTTTLVLPTYESLIVTTTTTSIMLKLPRFINCANITYKRPFPCTTRLPRPHQQHGLASVRAIPGKPLPKAWFSASSPPPPLPKNVLLQTANGGGAGDNDKGVDERTLKLGKSMFARAVVTTQYSTI